MGCGCEKTEKWLEEHADVPRGGKGPLAWRLHFRGEHLHLFPIFRERFPSDVARLEREHDFFEEELRTHGRIVSIDVLKSHAALEDRLLAACIEMGALPA